MDRVHQFGGEFDRRWKNSLLKRADSIEGRGMLMKKLACEQKGSKLGIVLLFFFIRIFI